MSHNIAPALMHRAVPIEDCIHLPNNPRRSDTEALAESYKQFGQLKTLIGVPADNDKIMIVSGNHQLRAARDILGWSHIAVDVHTEMTDEQVAAFVVLENHWGNVGDIDDAATLDFIEQSGTEFVDMFDMVGYDEMALASLENTIIMSELKEKVDPNAGWTPPERIDLNPEEDPFRAPTVQPGDSESTTSTTEEEEPTPVSTQATTESIVTQGSGVVASGTESKKAVIQYTLVFDNDEQQRVWYSFIRWVRSSPTYDGETTAQLLVDFIRSHSEL